MLCFRQHPAEAGRAFLRGDLRVAAAARGSVGAGRAALAAHQHARRLQSPCWGLLWGEVTEDHCPVLHQQRLWPAGRLRCEGQPLWNCFQAGKRHAARVLYENQRAPSSVSYDVAIPFGREGTPSVFRADVKGTIVLPTGRRDKRRHCSSVSRSLLPQCCPSAAVSTRKPAIPKPSCSCRLICEISQVSKHLHDPLTSLGVISGLCFTCHHTGRALVSSSAVGTCGSFF